MNHVRNSSEAVTVVVFTKAPAEEEVLLVVVGIGVLSRCGCQVGVAKPLFGFDPVACCMSFPCSLIRAGASF